MFPYTLTGLTRDAFVRAQARIGARSKGPAGDRLWVLLRGNTGWIEVPLEAMPLLLGVESLDDALSAVLQVDGVIRELTDDERHDAERMFFCAGRLGASER